MAEGIQREARVSMTAAIGRVLCGLWAFVLAQAGLEWLVFLWLAQATVWGPADRPLRRRGAVPRGRRR
jgi:hypothetical protein